MHPLNDTLIDSADSDLKHAESTIKLSHTPPKLKNGSVINVTYKGT